VIAKDATLSGPTSDPSAQVVVDRTAPNLPTLTPAGSLMNGFYKDSVTVTTADTGDPNLADGSIGSGIDTTQTTAPQVKSTSGTFTVTGSVADRAGNTRSASIIVKVDANAPTLNLVCPTAPIPFGTATSINWTASDGAGESGLATAASGTLTLNTSQHPSTYTSSSVTATDKVGHSTTKSCSFTIVKATPTITWANPAQILFGTSLSSTQLNATAPIAGTFAYTPPSGTVLQPGNGQTLSVVFSPTNTTDYNSATKSVLINVGFSQACLTTSLSGSVTVKSNQAYCIQTGGKLSGSITVQSGGALYINGGSVSGAITASGAKALTICAASVSGSLTVSSATGPVMVGAATGCAKNSLSGSVTLTSNTKGVTLVGNSISGSVTATSNSGGATVVSGNTVSQSMTVNGNTGGITVTNNKISKSLTVTNNRGGFTISGNTASSTTISGNT
jgi:hypothetical protein